MSAQNICMREILHCDLNNFYASVECIENPCYKRKALVVCGAEELRHGVVLAKNYIAKAYGVKTGDTLWEARSKCPELISVQADFGKYLQYSRRIRKIYEEYTDMVEAFGIDECWLDVTKSKLLFGDGKKIADEIRYKIKKETGLTASVGVSFNKIFAKLASDMEKPDATVIITKDNFKQKVFPLPVEDLLYVGKATAKKLKLLNINTIGELANAREDVLIKWLGKWGSYLYTFANGKDNAPVRKTFEKATIKSIGNSLTNYRDLKNDEEVKSLFFLLADSVAARLRQSMLGRAGLVGFSVKNTELIKTGGEKHFNPPTFIAYEIAERAFSLFKNLYDWRLPVRSVSIYISDFTLKDRQTDIFTDESQAIKKEILEQTVENIREKFGAKSINRGIVALDENLTQIDIKGEHIIHPEAFRLIDKDRTN